MIKRYINNPKVQEICCVNEKLVENISYLLMYVACNDRQLSSSYVFNFLDEKFLKDETSKLSIERD